MQPTEFLLNPIEYQIVKQLRNGTEIPRTQIPTNLRGIYDRLAKIQLIQKFKLPFKSTEHVYYRAYESSYYANFLIVRADMPKNLKYNIVPYKDLPVKI